MPISERELHPYIKLLVEEYGKLTTTEIDAHLRKILVFDEHDLTRIENRKDDHFSQIVRNLVSHATGSEIVRKKGYIIDKSKKPALFYARNPKAIMEITSKPVTKEEVVSNEEIERRTEHKRKFIARKIDFQGRHKENSLLGDAGERFALDWERDRLTDLGSKFEVLEEVIHSSKLYGDGSGYDILSKKDAGAEILYIEVKTTKGPENTPFYLSINELSFLEEYHKEAVIYRVFNFKYEANLGEIKVLCCQLM